MQRAEYTITKDKEISELKHSALNFELYTHFTSPIRRYPDLVVHRQLKYILKNKNLLEIIIEDEEFTNSSININKDESPNINDKSQRYQENNKKNENTIQNVIDNSPCPQIQISVVDKNALESITNIGTSNSKNEFEDKNLNKFTNNDLNREANIFFINSQKFLDFVIKNVSLKLNQENVYENSNQIKSLEINQESENLDSKIKEEFIEDICDLDEYSKDEIINYKKYIDHFNEKYYNGKTISSKCQKLFQCIFLKNTPNETYKALIVDISNKIPMKNKRTSQQNNFDTQTLVISIFIPKLNLEIVKIFLFIYFYFIEFLKHLLCYLKIYVFIINRIGKKKTITI